ncbi:exodeoxyribonuclease V subunit beta [Ideonella sp. A 288]|uniref:exodeoxyribonuclease V subunit beta n=1 Tax=Ideonella sp. A 288 TaxID=1962181 RepID=UPI000B4B174F|nr:exodeoxyribonuclease V subunit beta [Ideonella sp. A 288]
MTIVQRLDVHTVPLAGVQLIEASAGTGKTWAICGLYLRLLLERQLEVQQILVVTFTKAATAELRERIRQRIAEALAHVQGSAPPGGDGFVRDLIARLRDAGREEDTLQRQLDLALQRFDEAAIFTIHGFCHRALLDTPFTTQQPFELDALTDDRELVQQVAFDFWRRHVAAEGVDPTLIAALDAKGDTPERLAELLRRRVAKPLAELRWPQAIDAPTNGDTLAALAEAVTTAGALWHAARSDILGLIPIGKGPLNASSYKDTTVAQAAAEWDAWLQDGRAESVLAPPAGGEKDAKVRLLGTAALVKATNKGKTTPTHPFFTAAQQVLDARSAVLAGQRLARLRLLRRLLTDGPEALREAKRARHVVAYDDLLSHLHQRLQPGASPGLAEALRTRYPVALIDEFQDTDPLQFDIFLTLHGQGHGTLFLVGDPKQAIYRFRNADLHTYLGARQHTQGEHTLADNQRSSQGLIDAQNALFGGHPAAFMLPGLDYRPVGLGAKPRKAFVDTTPSALATAPLDVWLLPRERSGHLPLYKDAAVQAAIDATAAEIARLIGAGRRGEITIGGQPLGAGDIAVLVRTRRQGSQVRQALAALGVGSIELSQASVYQSPDAEELERLLLAVLQPSRERLLKAALATQLLGQDAAAIDALAGDEPTLLGWVQRFSAWRETWLRRGPGLMLRQMMAAERVAERLLRRPDGERRLTNLLHLVECLHQAAAEHPTPDALLRWLAGQRQDPTLGDEATQLRLESDQHLVQIVTIHKSKGLEYGVVFCPVLWDGHLRPQNATDGVEYHDADGRTVIDFRKGFDGEYDDAVVKQGIKLEDAAETLRLVYVALTRAVHRGCVVAGAYRTRTSKGGGSAKQAGRAVLNWLVAGQGRTPDAWLQDKDGATPEAIDAAWQALAARAAPGAIAVRALPRTVGTRLAPEASAADPLAALPPPAPLPGAWRIGSYSALVHGARHEQAAVDHDARAEAPVPDDAAEPAEPAPLADDDILRFPRGAAAGECLHAVFEHADFARPEGWPGAIAQALQAHGAALPPVADAAEGALRQRMVARMLADVLATELPVGTARPLVLAGVTPARRLNELAFHLPAPQLEPEALNRWLAAQGLPTPRLGFAPLRGFLKGYIDLVLEHDGRCFVVDWKSNHLGRTAAEHGPAAVGAAMASHGYHLQALLYALALQRHLRQRLAGYDHDRHFGGVLYLFVRGVRPAWRLAGGAPAGVHFHRPDEATLQQLADLLGLAESMP